ncbi:MAG: glycosyltransferase family 39 protein [Candidatus Levybacteria bacterium]|nr:glycosyltransferase family 39 protein [Candidatus Levybacteria bacterium]
MVSFVCKKINIILLFLFFISRIFFLNSKPIFFDSPEYLTRLSNPNFFQALISGHLPLHAGYILIFWPIFNIAKFLDKNGEDAVVFFQIILSTLAVYCFYKLIKIISNKAIALYSSVVVSLTPLFWITNNTLMMESTYIAFFIFSIYFLLRYLYSKNNENFYLVFCQLFFGISFLTHLAVILWIPFLFFLVFYINNKKIKKYFLSLLICLIFFTIVNSYFISSALNINLLSGILLLYSSKAGEHVVLSLNMTSFAVYLRNFVIPLLRNNTNLIIILGFISIVNLYFKNKKLFVLCFLWIAPSFVANQWWDSLFFGRHSLIAGFGFAFLVSSLINKSKFLTSILLFYLLIVSIPALYLLKTDSPYLKEAKEIKFLPNGLLIESHFARPQVAGSYKGKTVFVNEPGWDKILLKKEISENLKNKKPVFISSSALSDPYGLYSGPFLHSLSLSYAKSFELKSVIKSFKIEKYKTISKEDNLVLYKVVSEKNSSYPEVKSMKHNSRRIDYFDPFSQLFFYFEKL